MSEAKVKISVEDQEAKKRLEKIKGSLALASADLSSLASASSSGAKKKASIAAAKKVPDQAVKAAAAAAALVVAARVVESITQVISQELDARGFTFLGEKLDEISKGITSVTSIATKLQAAVATVGNVARPFAESGLPLPPGALYGAAKIGWERAQREAEAERRRTGRTAKLYKDTVADLLRFFT